VTPFFDQPELTMVFEGGRNERNDCEETHNLQPVSHRFRGEKHAG
jgi:hypothetical protein